MDGYLEQEDGGNRLAYQAMAGEEAGRLRDRFLRYNPPLIASDALYRGNYTLDNNCNNS